MRLFDTSLTRLASLGVLAALLAAPALAQRTVVIEPGPPGTFNNTIAGDTTATGDRVDANTTYVLRRGGVYIYNAQLQNQGYPLTIVAEDGDGPRPIIQAAFTGSGEASRPLRARADLTLRGLYFYGIDNAGVQTDNATVRVGAEDVTLIIDDCHFDGNRLSAVRTDNDGTDIYITNSVFSHNFNLDTSFGWNIFVNVGINVGDIVVRNTTFYNSNGIILNNAGSAEYTEFRHVTVHNAGVALDFTDVVDGGITDEFVFRDNIVYNGGYYGNSPSREERFVVDADSVFVDDDMNENTPEVFQELDFNLANANIYFDPAIAAAYPDSVSQRLMFGNAVQAFFDEQGGEESFFSEQLDFVDPPSTQAVVDRLTYYYENASEQGAPFLDRDPRDPANTPAVPGLTREDQLPVDFAYPTTARSYTAGTAGCPLGDLNWFPDVDAEACLMATSNEGDLEAASAVTVTVYDVLGRQVKAREAAMGAGNGQRVALDVSDLPSGTYVVRVRAEAGSSILEGVQRITVVR